MAAPFFVPFNFQPISIQRGSGTYTVPAGKYARVTINLSVFCTPGILNPGTFFNAGNQSENADIFLKSGDSLAFTQSLSASSVSPGTAILTNTLSASINGAPFMLCRHVSRVENTGGIPIDINRGSDSFWIAQEFANIT
jgi:hypothetical protein